MRRGMAAAGAFRDELIKTAVRRHQGRDEEKGGERTEGTNTEGRGGGQGCRREERGGRWVAKAYALVQQEYRIVPVSGNGSEQ